MDRHGNPQQPADYTVALSKSSRMQYSSDKHDTESGNESSESYVETIRQLPKRNATNRFPVKVSGSNTSPSTDPKSPGYIKPPPIPSRSHQRVISQQNGPPLRPSIQPLAGANERTRSNSESVLQHTNARFKRMGMITQKGTDLGTLDEAHSLRNSHNRGFSYSSALQDIPNYADAGNGYSSGQNESGNMPPWPGHLAEQKSTAPASRIIQGATALVFVLSNTDGTLDYLINSLREGSSRRLSLDKIRAYALGQLDNLSRALDIHAKQIIDSPGGGNHRGETVRAIKKAAVSSSAAYQRLCNAIANLAQDLLSRCDPRMARRILMLLHMSTIEVRNACILLSRQKSKETSRRPNQAERARDHSVTPTRERPNPARRMRSDSAAPYSSFSRNNMQPPVPLVLGNSTYRRFEGTSIVTSTSSFPDSVPGTPLHSSSRSNTLLGVEDLDKEKLFQQIYLQVSLSCDTAIRIFPGISNQFRQSADMSRKVAGARFLTSMWNDLNSRCLLAIETAEQMKRIFVRMTPNDPTTRDEKDLWQGCTAFAKACVDVMDRFREIQTMHKPLASEVCPAGDIRNEMRAIHKAVKDLSTLIGTSPWAELADSGPAVVSKPPGQGGAGGHPTQGLRVNTGLTSGGSQYVTPFPATPISAALGHAAQATVPSVQTTQSQDTFPYNIIDFDRNDSLMTTHTRGADSDTFGLMSPAGPRSNSRLGLNEARR